MSDIKQILRESPFFWSRLGFCYDPPRLDCDGKPIVFSNEFENYVSKFLSLNSTSDNINENVSDSKDPYSIGELLEIKNSFTKNTKREKRLQKEIKKRKQKEKKLKKIHKNTQNELNAIKQDINHLKRLVYYSKLNEIIACDDPAERKKLAAELKGIEV